MSTRRFAILIVSLVGLMLPSALFAATDGVIVAGASTQYARLCANETGNDDCHDYTLVNWHPSATQTDNPVVVTDTGLSGYIWSSEIGWINLRTSQEQVVNTTSGVLSGYAWSQTSSWVNFSPTFSGDTTNHGVQIDPLTGEFSGYAWVSDYGWMLFDCSLTDGSGVHDACVKTTWPVAAGGSSSSTTTTTTTTSTSTSDGNTGIILSNTETTSTTGSDVIITSTTTGTTGSDTTTTTSTDGGSGTTSTTGSDVIIGTTGTDGTTVILPDEQQEGFWTHLWRMITEASAQAVGRTVGLIGLVGSAAITLTTSLFLNSLALSDLFLIPLRLWSLLLSALGLAKRKKPWGTVYDSVTKQPLDPAYVVLRNIEGVDVATAITDLDGRYGFVAPEPGAYTLIVHKTNYLFPSQKLVGHDHDELYFDLYFGEHFSIAKAGEVVTRNIPMDPEKFDWNEFAKRQQHLMKFYSKKEKWLRRVSNAFFVIGFTVSSVTVIAWPTKYNIAIFCLYILLFFIRTYGLRSRPFGHIVAGETGLPVPFAIVRITQAATGVEIMHRVTDVLGRYYCLLPNGQYLVRIDRKKEDGTYETLAANLSAAVTKGYLSERFVVAEPHIVAKAEPIPTAPVELVKHYDPVLPAEPAAATTITPAVSAAAIIRPTLTAAEITAPAELPEIQAPKEPASEAPSDSDVPLELS